MRKIIKILLVSWLAVGVLGLLVVFICAGMSYCGLQGISSQIRFPIGELTSFAVDKEGRIFCYAGSLCRLQIFNKQGDFLRGWFVLTAFSTGKLYTDPNEYVNVVSSLDDHFIFDLGGNKLRESKEEGIYDRTYKMETSGILHRDNEGNIYKGRRGILRTQILKVNPMGEESIVVTDSFYFFPFRGGVSIALFFMPPMFILIGIRAWNERKKRREQAVPTKNTIQP